jgi:hypothetical protein
LNNENKILYNLLGIGMMLTPVVGYIADSDMDCSGPVTYVQDSVITTKIKTKLAAKTHLGSLKELKLIQIQMALFG